MATIIADFQWNPGVKALDETLEMWAIEIGPEIGLASTMRSHHDVTVTVSNVPRDRVSRVLGDLGPWEPLTAAISYV